MVTGGPDYWHDGRERHWKHKTFGLRAKGAGKIAGALGVGAVGGLAGAAAGAQFGRRHNFDSDISGVIGALGMGAGLGKLGFNDVLDSGLDDLKKAKALSAENKAREKAGTLILTSNILNDPLGLASPMTAQDIKRRHSPQRLAADKRTREKAISALAARVAGHQANQPSMPSLSGARARIAGAKDHVTKQVIQAKTRIDKAIAKNPAAKKAVEKGRRVGHIAQAAYESVDRLAPGIEPMYELGKLFMQPGEPGKKKPGKKGQGRPVRSDKRSDAELKAFYGRQQAKAERDGWPKTPSWWEQSEEYKLRQQDLQKPMSPGKKKGKKPPSVAGLRAKGAAKIAGGIALGVPTTVLPAALATMAYGLTPPGTKYRKRVLALGAGASALFAKNTYDMVGEGVTDWRKGNELRRAQKADAEMASMKRDDSGYEAALAYAKKSRPETLIPSARKKREAASMGSLGQLGRKGIQEGDCGCGGCSGGGTCECASEAPEKGSPDQEPLNEALGVSSPGKTGSGDSFFSYCNRGPDGKCLPSGGAAAQPKAPSKPGLFGKGTMSRKIGLGALGAGVGAAAGIGGARWVNSQRKAVQAANFKNVIAGMQNYGKPRAAVASSSRTLSVKPRSGFVRRHAPEMAGTALFAGASAAKSKGYLPSKHTREKRRGQGRSAWRPR